MDETKYDFGEEEAAGCCTAAVGETFGLSDDEMLLFGERCVSGETELLDESAVIADCTDDGAVAGATAGGDAPVLPGRRNSGRRADRPHRRRRKLMTIAAIFALIAIAFSVWFFACNSVEGGVESKQPSDSVSYCLTPPSDGSLPEDHTALDNLGYVIGRLTGRSCYHTESSSVVTAKAMGVTVNQYVEGGKDYKDGVLISTTFSRGEGLGAPAPVAVQRFFGKDRAVLRNSVSSDPSTWAGADTEWADGEPSEVIAREEYADRYGLWGTEFSDYVMTEETILSFSELERDGEIYELSFSLDPATATYYYGKQMVTMGGLSESPQFMYADVTLRFTSDWSVTEMTVSERYVSVKGVINADTSGETVIKYSYDEADADVSAYETYFSKYADAEPTGDAEKDRSAADYLTEGFGSVLVSDRTAFDVGAVINGKSVTGRALLAMDGGSPSSVTLELGELTALADISDGRIYVSYKDFLGSLALSDVSELLGGALPVGDISIDLESALADAAVTRGEGCAEVAMTLAIGDLALPLRFEFSETDADVAWTGIYADLDLGGIAVSLTVTPGDASVPFEEIDRGAATDIMPAVRAILALAQGPVRADISYAGDGFTLAGDVVFGSDSDVMSGSITVSTDGISPVDVAFAYSDGDVYLSVGGIKVRAVAGDWVSALLGLAGSELPAVSDIDLGRVADALLGMDFDSVIESVTLDAGGLALTLDCDAIISSLLPDSGISMGKLTAAFDSANNVFTVSVLGVDITLGGADAMPSLPEGMENYVLLTPEQALGFADAVKAIAGSDDIAFGMSGTVTINGISVDAEIAGEVWTDTNAVVLVVTVSGESVRLVYDGGITVIYGDHGLRMSEEELNDMLASLSSLFGDASATSVLAELDIASLLADIKLFTANGNALGIAADLSSLLADTSMNFEVSYSSDGVSLSGTVTIAGVTVESASAYVRTADDELSSSVDGVTMCGNAVKFAMETYLELIDSGAAELSVSYVGDKFTLDGDVVFGSDSDVMSGSITVSADGISPVDVAFAYSDGDVYLSVGGIKVRAAAGDWVSALLGLAGSELPAVSDIDLGRVADALLGMDFDSVIENVTLDAGGLALTLDCDAIISSLLPDSGISIGKLTASFDPANSVFTASVLGIEITLGGTDAMPSLPEGMENYVLLTPEQALGFADAVKAVAGSDDIAFGMSGTVTINGISVDAEIAGEVWTDTNAVVLVVTVSGESVRLVYDGGITVIYGDHGLRMSEEELNDMLASLSSLFGDASATSVLAELDIASLLADIKLFTANGNALGIAADLSSLLADTSMNFEVSYSSDGVSLSGTVTIAGVTVESASAYVRTADDELSSSVDGVTMCGNAVEFALEAYMRLTGSEYISFEVAHRAEGLTADVKGEIKLVRTESAIAFELAADAAVRSGDDTYYIQVRLVDDTLYVYFSLVGFEDSAYFPDCVDASARPLRLRFTVGSVAAAARDLMPLISSLMAEEWDGSGLLGMAAELLGRVDGALTTDIADIKTTGEWAEFILSLVGSDGAKSSADGGRMNVTVDTSLRRLTLKDEATSVVIGTGIMRSVTAPEAEHIDLSSVAELAGTLMSSITSSAEDGEGTESVRINDYYYLSGSASGSLGSLELTSIGIAASVYVHPDYSVTVNVRLTVSYFIGVFNGDTVLDMTVEDGMVYMVRTQTSEAGFLGIEKQLDEPEVIFRAMTLDSFLSGMLEQIPFMFNFSDSISGQITGSGSGSGSDPAAVTDIGDVLLSVAYSASEDGSQAWTLGIGLGALTGGVLGDASVQLRAGADGVLEDIILSASLSVLTMNAELKYVNPGAGQDSGHAVDVTENVAGRVSRLLAKAIARGDGFAEGRAAVITYSADGNAIGSEEMAYSAEGEVLTELEMPDLTGYGNGGYTYSWGELASVSGDVTLEAEKAANSYPVVLVSEYEIDGLDGEVRDGAYVYELTYTYGTTLALPAGAVSGMAYSLSYFTDGSERFTEVSGITSPLTLTAVWEEIEYTVTYTVLGEVYDVITYGYGDELILPECAPAGYTFVRWDADTDIVTSDMTVEAVLSVTVDVISGTAADGMERMGDAYASSVRVEGKTAGDFATLPEFTADGYESFGLWVKGDDGWRPATDLAGMDGAELYAAWASDISVTITEAGKSFWSTWTVRGTFSGGTFDDDISREIASDAGVTTSARAQLCLYKVDGSGNITDTDKLSEVSADGGSFGKSGMTSFFGVTGTWHGGAEVTVTLSCEGMSLTLTSRAWQ